MGEGVGDAGYHYDAGRVNIGKTQHHYLLQGRRMGEHNGGEGVFEKRVYIQLQLQGA